MAMAPEQRADKLDPRGGSDRDDIRLPLDRRHFLSASAIALLGITATPRLFDPAIFLAETRPALVAAWRPIAELATVSVAADASARGYPALTPGPAFDSHPAVALLERSLAGLSGGSAVDAVRAAVAPGGTALIKPNWVEPWRWSRGKITHPALVIAMARIVAEAVGPSGDVIIAEGTSEGRDLPTILSATGFMEALHAFGLDAGTATRARVRVVDLNSATAGSVAVQLRGLSRFAGVRDRLLDASGRVIGRMGDGRVGTYRIARPILDADLLVDFAKAKVHCSAGVTLALKNFLGITPSGRDPAGRTRLKTVPHSSTADKRAGRTYVRNRTIGRTSADLQACARYLARDGSLQRTPQRAMLGVVDGIVSGQTNQFSPRPKATGWIAAGYDPVALDHVGTRCMGFDPARVISLKPAAKGTLRLGTANPGSVRVAYSGPHSFVGYFNTTRRLKPESVAAKWGSAISLKAWSIKAPLVDVDGTSVTVWPRSSGLVARLVSDAGFIPMARRRNGSFAAEIPATPGPVRLVVMDAHFNVWERQLKA